MSVFNLPGIRQRKWELYDDGIINLDELAEQALADELITSDEAVLLTETEVLRKAVINVDDFDNEELIAKTTRAMQQATQGKGDAAA